MIVTIDPHSGFCFGVKEAVLKAENNLLQKEDLFCLGEIVHNGEETSRLQKLGLKSIEKDKLKSVKNTNLLIRAHGEPPQTYEAAKQNNLTIIDATCPIVLKLQDRINKAWMEMQEINGQIAIIGKEQHPEVVGLNGQTEFNAIILQETEDIHKINMDKPLRLFAQTTINTEKYEQIIQEIKININAEFIPYNTICKQVSNRKPSLIHFCKDQDVVIFVSGKNSSNGKALYNICKSNNAKSYHISTLSEIKNEWFDRAKKVGISGATSTPMWLMENVKDAILSI